MASEAHTLRVQIIQATGLQHLNKLCKDELFCTCEVVHAEKRAKATKCQTQAVNCPDQPDGSLEPVWQEQFDLYPWHVGEPLEFKLMDKGLLNSRQEGDKVVLDSDYFYPQPFEGMIPIGHIEHASLFVVVHVLGAGDEAMQAQQPGYHQQAVPQEPAPVTAHGPPQRLQVAIVKAVGLKQLNITGDSSFCTCEVIHADQHAKATKVQTKVVKNTLEPDWNETLYLDPWYLGEPIVFTVTDGRAEGQAELPSEYIDPDGFEGEVPINGLQDATVYVQVLPAGPSQGGASAAQGGGQKLEVTFYHANGLKQLNHSGDNPFVTCEVKHAERRAKPAKCQSKPCIKTLNPVWNETHTIQPYFPGEPLLFTVHDKGLIGSKLEGKVELPADHFYHGFDGELQLQGLPSAFLHVRVAPIGSADAEQPAHAPSAQASYPAGVSFPYAASPHASGPSPYAVTQQPSYPYQPQHMATMAHGAPVSYTGAPSYATHAAVPGTPSFTTHSTMGAPLTYGAPTYAAPGVPSHGAPVSYGVPAGMAFDQVDVNHDGVITRQEFVAAAMMQNR